MMGRAALAAVAYMVVHPVVLALFLTAFVALPTWSQHRVFSAAAGPMIGMGVDMGCRYGSGIPGLTAALGLSAGYGADA